MASQRHEGFDAVVLAGDRGASRTVLGRNKAYLEIEGAPLVSHVLAAAEDAQYIRGIHLVGPKERLEGIVSAKDCPFRGKKQLTIVEQRNTLFENVMTPFLQMLPEYYEGKPWQDYLDTPSMDRAVFVLPCDIPLVSPYEIDSFLSQCHDLIDQYDYLLGLTPEEDLRAYYPTKYSTGIKMAYFYLRSGKCRQSNLSLVKPLRVRNREYLQLVYEYRYQKEFFNMVKAALDMIRLQGGGLKLLGVYGGLQVSLILARLGLERLTRLSSKAVTIQAIENVASRFLDTRFKTLYTSPGGAALDIDNEEDYETIKTNFQKWRRYQHDFYERASRTKGLGQAGET